LISSPFLSRASVTRRGVVKTFGDRNYVPFFDSAEEAVLRKVTFSTGSLPHTVKSLIIGLAKYIKTYIIFW
jgi:hypothetical protein